MSAHSRPRIATVTTVHNGTSYAPQGDPTWSTVKGADIPDGTLAYLYGSDSTTPRTAPVLVYVNRAGRVVRFTDALTGCAVDECSASARRWIVAATETITEAEANRCKRGFSARSNRVETCRHCDQSVDAHSHGDPSDLSWDKTSRYAHLADRFHPVYVPPVPTTCEHPTGQPGCMLPQCNGVPTVADALTSVPVRVPSEPSVGEYGTDTVGRALGSALSRMLRTDAVGVLYADSQAYDRPGVRRVQGWTCPTRVGLVTFLTYEIRTPLTGARSVWSVQVDGKLIEYDGSVVIESFGLSASALYGKIASIAATAIGTIDTYGLPVPGVDVETASVSVAPVADVTPAHAVDMIHAAHAVSPVAEAPATPDSTPNTDTEEPAMSTPDTTGSNPAPGPESSLRAALVATPAPAGLSVTVDRRALTDALAFLAKGIGRPSIPILSGVEISAQGDTVTLRTFDYETERVVTLPADVTRSGRAAVGCKALADLVKGKALTGARVTLTDTGSAMTVECGPARLSVETLPVEDMPSLGFTVEPFASLDIRTLAPALAITGRSAGKDATLPFLTGVQINAVDGAMEMQSTDRYRVAFATVPTTGARSVFLVPPAALVAEVTAAMAKAAGKAGAAVVIGEHGHEGFRWMSLTCGAYHMVTRTLDGKQMPLIALKPVDAPHVGTVDSEALKSAVQTLAGAVGKTFPVILDWSAGTVTVRAAGQSGIPVPVDYTGEPVTVALNPAYLSDGLSAVKGRVTVAVKGGQKPVMITPADGAEAPAGFEYLVVPIRIDGAPEAPATPKKEDTVSTDSTPAPVAEVAPVVETTGTPESRAAATAGVARIAAHKARRVPAVAPVTEAPAVPATDPRIERSAQNALVALNEGRFSAARSALNTAEMGAPVGYLVGGRYTFDQVHAIITARQETRRAPVTPAPVAEAEAAPAPVAEAAPVDQADAPAPVTEAPAATYAPAVLTHDTDGTALTGTPFLLRFKVSAALNGKRGGLGWMFNKTAKAWILDNSAGRPVDGERVAALVATLAGIGITVDDKTGAPVASAPVAPVVTPAPVVEAPAPVVIRAPVVTPDAAVIEAARVAGVETLTSGAPAPVADGTRVFNLVGELDLSHGYRGILKPVRQALARAGVSVSVLNVGRRVTVVGKDGGPLSAEACATVNTVFGEILPSAVPAVVSV